MTSATLDRDRLRELFDLRSSYNAYTGGTYEDDPYPVWHRLREEGPVLPGILHELTGSTDPLFFHGLPYPDSPHFTVFDYDSCMTVYRNSDVFASSPEPVDLEGGPLGLTNSMLSMGGNSTSVIAHSSNRHSYRRTANGGSTIGSPRRSTCSSTGSCTTDTPN